MHGRTQKCLYMPRMLRSPEDRGIDVGTPETCRWKTVTEFTPAVTTRLPGHGRPVRPASVAAVTVSSSVQGPDRPGRPSESEGRHLRDWGAGILGATEADIRVPRTRAVP